MEARTLILMGRTGNGKSSTGNSILGRNAFKTGLSFASVTQQCQLEKTTRECRTINVIDTPGLFDTNSANSKEFLRNQFVKCIDLAKDGVHGLLYVVSVKNRFTAEEAGILDTVQLLFGPEIVNYVVVVFTGGDDLENDGLTLKDYLNDCQPQLEEVLRRCNMRTVLFNNKSTSPPQKDQQRCELLNKIEDVIHKNGGKPYCNELLRQARENLEKLLSRQSKCALAGNACGEEEMQRINAEHIKQLNAMVEEKLQTTIQMYEERLLDEKKARVEAEEIASEALQLSNKFIKVGMACPNSAKMCPNSGKMCPNLGHYMKWPFDQPPQGCSIM